MNVDENLATTDVNVDENLTAPEARPTHLYAINDGEKYGYVAAVSEEERKQGKAAGDVVMFVYRGREGDKYKIDQVSPDGIVIADFECAQSCAAIKEYTYSGVKYVGFEPASLIGEAFTDAFNGFLNPAPLPRFRSANRGYFPSPAVTPPGGTDNNFNWSPSATPADNQIGSSDQNETRG